MSSCAYLKTHSHTMKCGPSHTATCTFHSEADAAWGKILMFTLTPNQPSNLTQNQPSKRLNWSHYRRTRRWPEICTSLQHASRTLAIRYQTCRLTPMTFPR